MNELPLFGAARVPAAMCTALLAFLAVASPAAEVQGDDLRLEWQVRKGTRPLERELVVTLKDARGSPVDGAQVDIAVDMPSMPMMHRVPVARAKPTGTPGRYSAMVEMEMAGEWAAKVTVSGSRKASWVRKFRLE